jgi:dipeptidyl aminopeptidase/acylaminoacyl peptidase
MPSATPFHDLDRYVAMPRMSGLVLSADGSRLVTGVAALDPTGVRSVTSLWEVDPRGQLPARRLTRSAKGESGPVFLPDGSLLFVSSRPDAEADPDIDDTRPAVWALPPSGGEAFVVATLPGGVTGLSVAREKGTIVLASPMLPSSATADEDEQRRAARKDRKVTAILHDSYPVRYWDRDLGPARRRLFAGQPPGAEGGQAELRDLTGHVGAALQEEATWDLSADGRTVVVTWTVPESGGSERSTLVALDTATGERRTLADGAEHEYADPVISPDGRTVAVIRHVRAGPQHPSDVRLVLVPLDGGPECELALGWDRWPGRPTWTPDGSAILTAADDRGSAPIFRVPLDGSVPVRLTADHGAYTDVRVSPDGRWVYALRSAVDAPPAPVRLEAHTAGQQPVPLPSPVPPPLLPGRLTQVDAVAEDGTGLRAWMVVPEEADTTAPAPLLVWVHGGPLGSWNAWSWRWNPWLAAAWGYAVLLPDPALSTGYGQAFLGRGWGRWGSVVYGDVMTLTDAAVQRKYVDADRTAMMGGSFGGYMANWIAGHTDRFAAIVSHAGLWALDQFGPTTDGYFYWRREMTPAMAAANSPHHHLSSIRTPMLVIHGDKDYRVPVGEGLRLWAELSERHAGEDGTMPHKFLYFPSENHWVISPQHARVWYETVFAFLAHHVHGEPWVVPEVLR